MRGLSLRKGWTKSTPFSSRCPLKIFEKVERRRIFPGTGFGLNENNRHMTEWYTLTKYFLK